MSGERKLVWVIAYLVPKGLKSASRQRFAVRQVDGLVLLRGEPFGVTRGDHGRCASKALVAIELQRVSEAAELDGAALVGHGVDWHSPAPFGSSGARAVNPILGTFERSGQEVAGVLV